MFEFTNHMLRRLTGKVLHTGKEIHEVLTDLSETTTLTVRILTKASVLGVILFALSGCSVLVGNIKPVTEKSTDYTIIEIDREFPNWLRLESELAKDENEKEDTSDVAYQSKSTASIISLTTGCRPRNALEDVELRQFTDTLLLSVSEVSERKEKEVLIDQIPGLETVLSGKMNGNQIQLKSVVLRKDECLFDFVYISRPEHFGSEQPVFERFLSSFRSH